MVLWTCWLVVPYYLSENSNLLSVFKQTLSIALMCKKHTVVPGEWSLPIVVALSSNNLSDTLVVLGESPLVVVLNLLNKLCPMAFGLLYAFFFLGLVAHLALC